MDNATAQLLTAHYALAHRLALTPADETELERAGANLSPELWASTRALLKDAERCGPGATIDLGFAPLVLRWLGLHGEPAFVDAHGASIAEVLARDCQGLARLAAIIEHGHGPTHDGLGYAVAVAWINRASVLFGQLPTSARAIIEAVEQARRHSPPEPTIERRLNVALHHAATASGELERAAKARERVEAIDSDEAFRDRQTVHRVTAAQLLATVWCVSHDAMLLDSERGLDPGIERSPRTWAGVVAAVDSGRLDGIPLPARTVAAWSGARALDARALRQSVLESAEVLAETARAVEALWSGGGLEETERSVGACLAHCTASLRKRRLEAAQPIVPGTAQDTGRRAALLDAVRVRQFHSRPHDTARAAQWAERWREVHSTGP